jgi:hypothetical protein
VVRKVALWIEGTIALVVVLSFCCVFVTPWLREKLNPPPEHAFITGGIYAPGEFDKANKMIENGWVITELGHDSCGNIYVYMERN